MKKIRENYNHTVYACYGGYVTQAIVNNYIPLLFLTFHKSYGIPLDKIALLVSFNFGIQLLTDIVAARYASKIGYRRCLVGAHFLCGLGLVALAILPGVFPNAFAGILCSVFLYAVGGGLIEVLISPTVEACPSDNKEAAMSLSHSFYCWGHVGVVVISTVFFALVGIDKWKYMAFIWAVIPLLNGLYFGQVPLAKLEEDSEGSSLKVLFKQKTFWGFVILMLCSGAAEQSMSQWASAFAEKGLGVGKTVGDLLGPCAFAVFMGLSRVFYGKYGEKIAIRPFMIGSSVLCVISYLIAGLSQNPFLGLVGCMLCGISVGIMWPGTFSIGAKAVGNSAAMGAMFALGGDLGCAAGPAVVGFVADTYNDNLQLGILVSIVFPLLLIAGLVVARRYKKI